MEEVVQLISNVGFPIAAFLLMYFQNSKTLEKFDETIDKNTSAIEKLTAVVSGKVDS